MIIGNSEIDMVDELYELRTLAIIRKSNSEDFKSVKGKNDVEYIEFDDFTVLMVVKETDHFKGGILIPHKYTADFMKFPWGYSISNANGRIRVVSSNAKLFNLTKTSHTYSYHFIEYMKNKPLYPLKDKNNKKYVVDHEKETFNDCYTRYVTIAENNKDHTSHRYTAIFSKNADGDIVKQYIEPTDRIVFYLGRYNLYEFPDELNRKRQ